MRNDFNPWESIRMGQQAEQGLAQAEQEGLGWRERLALKRAMGQMGSQNYFTGYEGVPGAEKPGYLKEAFSNVDPEHAVKLEEYMAKPFEMERAANQAGKIRAAQKASDLDYSKSLMKEFYGMPGAQEAATQGGNMFGQYGQAPGSGVLLPGQSLSGSSGAPPSAVERTFEITPTGPKFGMKQLSEIDARNKQSEITSRTAGTALQRDQYNQTDYQNAIQNVQKSKEALQAAEEFHYNTGQGQGAIAQAHEELKVRRRELNTITRTMRPGAAVTEEAPAYEQEGSASPVPQPQDTVPLSRGPSSQLPAKMRDESAKKRLDKRTDIASGAIEAAQTHAATISAFRPKIDALVDLVTKEELGHPAAEGLPLADNILSLWRANAQLKKLHDDVTSTLIKQGESQLLNTLIERQMMSSGIPGLYTDPQLNRKSAAWLKSNATHNLQLPTFLERWADRHNGTLDGASDMWLDYTKNNQLYEIETDKRGTVSLHEKPVIPVDRWMQLRAQGKIRDVQGRTFIQQSDGAWKAQ